MPKKMLSAVTGIALAAASAAAFANSGWNVGVFISAPVYPPPYFAGPPPVVYAPPRIVYAAPPYYMPPPYYAPAYGHRFGHPHGWNRHPHEGWRR